MNGEETKERQEYGMPLFWSFLDGGQNKRKLKQMLSPEVTDEQLMDTYKDTKESESPKKTRRDDHPIAATKEEAPLLVTPPDNTATRLESNKAKLESSPLIRSPLPKTDTISSENDTDDDEQPANGTVLPGSPKTIPQQLPTIVANHDSKDDSDDSLPEIDSGDDSSDAE